MKRSFGISGLVVLAALLAAPLLPGVARAGGGPIVDGPVPQVVTPAPAGLTVVGTGVVTLKPDRAYLTVGMQSTARTAREAQAAAGKLTAAVLAALQALPAVQDIHTLNISLYPQYPQPGPDSGKGGEAPQPASYQAVQTLALTVVDVSKAGSVLDVAVKAGANTQTSVSFGMADTGAARAQALSQAVADARAQAQQAARAAGLTLKGMTAMVVLPSAGGTPIPYGMGGGGAGSTPILPGSVQVSAAVQMTFAY